MTKTAAYGCTELLCSLDIYDMYRDYEVKLLAYCIGTGGKEIQFGRVLIEDGEMSVHYWPPKNRTYVYV